MNLNRMTWKLAVLLLVAAPVGAAEIVINEIMYRPPPVVPEDRGLEWIELHNTGTNAVNLRGWRFTKGISYTFPADVLVPPGGYFLVVADVGRFEDYRPDLESIVAGPWIGTLGNNGEEIELEDAQGEVQDDVAYSNEGDWGTRVRGPLDRGSRGWEWFSEHDGLGKSLELIQPLVANDSGQNWAASLTVGGTPGAANSVRTPNIPPLILEVQHSPTVPQSTQTVTITARLVDEQDSGIVAALFHRNASTLAPPAFSSTPMLDDGFHNDGVAGDGVFGAILPPQASGTVIEYYVQASDQTLSRTWPAPALNEVGSPVQAANALYQVDDSAYSGSHPIYRLVMTETERSELQFIDRSSDAEMNATFITTDGVETKLRHNVGARIRGAGSRSRTPPNLRVNIPADRRWNGVTEINLNTQYGFLQLVGSALLQKSGLPAADVRAIQVRINGGNQANSGLPQYGAYALVEVINGDWAQNHLPEDDGGNVYRGSTGNHSATLSYLGTDFTSYINAGYSKTANSSQNEWTDLFHLTEVLTSASDLDYVSAVREVVNVEMWMRYFALFTVTTSMETSLATGRGDDFAMYRGLNDPRFLLVPHDLDTILGQGDTVGNVNANLFRMCPTVNGGANTFVLNRFMTNAAFVPIYYRELKRLVDTTFSPGQLDPLIDNLLGSYVPSQTRAAMKQFAVNRNAYIRSQIPTNLTVNVGLSQSSGYFQSFSPSVSLGGEANVIDTRSLRVNGVLANWIPWLRNWNISGVALNPGINRVLIQAFNEQDQEIERSTVDIWYDTGSIVSVPGTISTDIVWTPSAGPYSVGGNVTVSAGATLTIQPGTTVYFASGASLTVNGRLLAEGTETQRIRLTRTPGASDGWAGVRLNNSNLDNRLTYADLEFSSAGDAIALQNSRLLVDHVTWTGTTRTIVDLVNSSLIVRHSVFPTIVNNETIHGTGMPPDGYVIIEGNYFGGTTGYSDIIDFTGGRRPGPIIQVLDNVFNGGSDDALDLDGTDAHIEGNVFMHIHQDAPRDSSANAIATDDNSEITVVRNIFYDLDHAILLKNGAFLTAHNNTFVGCTTAVIQFDETNRVVNPGRGAYLDGNILWNNASLFKHLYFEDPVENDTDLTVNRSILQGTNWSGTGNLNADPRFVNLDTNTISHLTLRNDLRLGLGSPAAGTGPNGLDMGAIVPAGASISGEPVSPTPLTSATLTVGGPGITHYRYSVNGGAYGSETSVANPIVLTALANGPYTVRVIGKNSASVWQSANAPTVSRTWTVNMSVAGIRINEVLARNVSAVSAAGETPDLIELYNSGSAPVVLAGMGLSDDLAEPFKFVFPPGTTLASGGYLVLYADNGPAGDAPSGFYLGFALDQNGDAIHLRNSAANGGALLDSVVFGMQLPDLSIGRLRDGRWGLTQPTFGAANVAQPVGDPARLKINEWLADGRTLFVDDFVELFNPDSLPVPMGGLFLSDEPLGLPTLHQIAPLSFLAEGGHVAFIADGDPQDGATHLNFKLSPDQGMIGLFNTQTNLIDCVIYGPQVTDISEGRRPSGADTISFFGPPTLTQPTPGAPNPGSSGIITVSNITVNLLPMISTWRYDRSNFDLGTEWRAIDYNDSGWEQGLALLGVESSSLPFPIGTFFPNYNSFQVTYYFRTRFVVNTNLAGFDLALNTVLDDGAVIYLNGTELPRIRMPAGPISHTTIATVSVDNATLETITIPATALVQGTNTLAVEVHQRADPSSSDVVWGMALDATLAITNFPPVALVLNEVMANNLSVTNLGGTNVTDWVELYNPSVSTVNLTGMSLTDDVAQPRRWIFPPGTTIPSGAYLVVQFDSGSPASHGSPLNTGFGLGANGDEVYLFDTPARGGALLDSVAFGIQAADFSIGRVALAGGTSGIGAWKLALPTQGSANIEAGLGPVAALRINEWMANPASGDDDYIELFNPNPQPVDLGGLFLTDSLTLPLDQQHRIAPLSFVGPAIGGTAGFATFIADDQSANGPNHLSFGLRGAGEAIGLSTTGGSVIDSLSFGSQANGVSEGRFPDGSTNIVRFPGTPTPGESNLLPLSDVVISEVLTRTDLPFEDAIELQNVSPASIDISGWYLSDSRNDLKRFRIPAGTVIPAGGFAVFYEYQFNPDFSGRPPFFSLNSVNGDQVLLSTADAAGNLTGYRAEVSFGAAGPAVGGTGVSFGRHATSVGADFTALSARTFDPVSGDNPVTVEQFRAGKGGANAYPRVGPVVINEIMYHPPDIGTNDNSADEYIELLNLSAGTVPLFHPDHPTNTWRLRDAVDFEFPLNVSLAPSGSLLVVSFDPATNAATAAAFRSRYGVNAAVPIFGPWRGRLANDNENIELYRPDAPQPPGTADAGFVPYFEVDKVRYADSAPWPALADGNTNGVGMSLQRRTSGGAPGSGYGNDPVNWVAGVPTPGAPTAGAALTVPSITSFTSEHTVPPGASDVLTVVAGGTGPLAYQWRFNGALIPGAISASLNLNNFQAANAGVYSVLVINGAGATSSSVRVHLRSVPIISRQPQSLDAAFGGSAVFSAVAGGTPPLSYQWRKNNVELGGATGPALMLNNLQDSDAANYRVVITNVFGSITSSPAALAVVSPPSIVSQPQGTNVFVGMIVTLRVNAIGNQPLQYQWRRSGVNLPGATGATLTITNVQSADAGNYRVLVVNSVGSALSDVVTVDVTVPPTITITASDAAASEPSGNPGQFTIMRTGSTQFPQQVNFAVSGTAVPNADYVTLSSPVIIPAGANSRTLAVSVIDDLILEGNETVMVTLTGGVDQSVGSPGNATVTIFDNDNLPPTVALTNPVDGVTVVLPTNITLRATASDPNGSVVRVEFFNHATNKIGEATSVPYFFNWTNAPVGSNALIAVATDDLGLSTTSAPVRITVSPPLAGGFADNFASRGLLTGFTNFVFTNNSNYSKEPGEPQHAGGTGTNSAWISWVAPASGNCIVSTLTNGLPAVSNAFDTVLAVYTGSAVSSLTPIVSSDDFGNRVQSQTNFNATAGTSYHIAVAGFNATAKGNIYFRLYMPGVSPVITVEPQTVVVNPGAGATFSVTATGTPPLSYQWRRNGTAITGATGSTLVQTNVQYTDAGTFSISVANPSGTAFSQPVELLVRPRFIGWSSVANGGLQWTYQAMPNRGHVIEITSNFVNWTLYTAYTNAAVQGQVLDTNGVPFQTGRAYRVRVQ